MGKRKVETIGLFSDMDDKRIAYEQPTMNAPHIGRSRADGDCFYTTEETVEKCLNALRLDAYDFVIEPSAGTGAFSNAITHPNLLSMDIAPQAQGIIRQDFFKFSMATEQNKVLIVGNPPFGIHHRSSDAFIKHSLSLRGVTTIAFILPNTYRKHTRQKILPREWRIKKIVELGRNAFIFDGKPYHVPCSFFIFDKSKGKDLRIDPSQHKEAVDFAFGTNEDYAFFLFGANPSKIVSDPKPNNRGYYIKPKIPEQELIDRIRGVDWRGNSCARGGVAWFTRTEIVMQYNEVYA